MKVIKDKQFGELFPRLSPVLLVERCSEYSLQMTFVMIKPMARIVRVSAEGFFLSQKKTKLHTHVLFFHIQSFWLIKKKKKERKPEK